ncbi:Ig-like domain-containing protein [Ruicaihuangia caeni]|uniref:Ig-like domain-containing protein n=1 Tax=Ruicaihuangia caeni TaxID=3042517 RepID=UPI00338EEC8A
MRRKSIASATVLALGSSLLVGAAVLHDGFPVTDVDLDQRTVWVTNGEDLLAGRLNRQIEELDASVHAMSAALDIVQHGEHVFLVDDDLGTVERIDPAFTDLAQQAQLPAGAEVRLGGTTMAILEPRAGSLWVTDVANELSFDPITMEPTAELGSNAEVTVTRDGAVYATSPGEGLLYRFDGADSEPTERSLDVPLNHQLTAVGDRAVVLDLDGDTVLTGDGRSTELPVPGIHLQLPGDEAASVLVAAADGLLRVPLDGGEVQHAVLEGAASARAEGVAAPVWLNGCAHGAWADSQRYQRWCDDADAVSQEIDTPAQGSEFRFRVNRDVVALNDLSTGNVWLIDANMRLVDNWEEVTPPEQTESDEGGDKSTTQSFEDTLAERTEQNRPPIAVDDDYGIRPGRTTILPVLDNDTDPDGDVLTITGIGEVPGSFGVIDAIDGARALQFTPAPDAVGGASFRYTVDDGRGGTAQAQVSMRIVPGELNAAPVAKRVTALKVEPGQSISHNVLADWVDPDGDDIYLASASPTSADIVRHTADGFVTFESRSTELGMKTVQFVVSDGALTSVGTLEVEVVEPGSLNPIATPDFATAFVGETVVVEPVANDLTPSGQPLRLLGIDELPDALETELNLERGTIAVRASTPGAHYFKYSLGAGAKTTVGLIRVEAIDAPADDAAPVPVKDTAFLRPGEPTTVSVLANDVSPSGRVLAVQSVDTGSTDAALSVELLRNTVIRVTASAALTAQTQFTYTVSDGIHTAVAGVTVVPVPPLVNRQPPVAADDRYSVRAGDIVTAAVLDNDFHPDNAAISLERELIETENDGGGLAFVSDDAVRYQAPEEPGEYSVVYRIADQFGETATARVHFVVTPRDLESNQPPQPAPQTGRVFAGNTVRIEVPLHGIDPDGDSVMVVGMRDAPSLGRIVETTSTSFVYEAFATSAGTDTFSYEVQDIWGARAIGTIDVGVIPPPAQADPPNAVDDSIQMKPGRTASVPVLLNDSDPAGHALKVSGVPEVDEGITAETDGVRVIVEVSEVEAAYTVRYEISNGHGGVDTAFLQIEVTEDAAPLYPSASDHVIEVDEVVDADYVDVDVLATAENAGGRIEDLNVEAVGPNRGNAEVLDNGQVRVRPGDTRIAIAYTLTNEIDGLSASAFIIVPPAVSANWSPPPYLRPDLPEQIVRMNGEGTWRLDDILVVPSGRPAVITDVATVRSTNGNGTSNHVDRTTLRFEPATDYRGGASIVFEVTDGADANDLNGNKAWITLPITVGDPDFEDVPPTFTPQHVTIEAGEDPLEIDLRASSSHPNPGILAQLEYRDLVGGTDQISAQQNGSTVRLSSPLGTQKGASTTLRFNVTYGEFSVPGTVEVRVVASTRPLARATADEAKGQRGVVQTVDVLANDFNPFAAQGEPLRIIDAWIENDAESQASVSRTSSDVTVRPGSAFIGVVSVIYVIEDGTRDPDRQVQGRLQLTVRDVPDQPSAPTVAPGDQKAFVTFSAPATNGEPIIDYTIRWTGGGGGQMVVGEAGPEYTIQGLTNGVDYRFTVTARNMLGSGAPSSQSAAVRPFGKPTVPQPTGMTASTSGDGRVTMSWSASSGNGRDVQNYQWQLFQGGSQVASGQTNGTTLSAASAQTVGRAYTFRVQAIGPGGASGWSGQSTAATPTPGTPGGASASTGSRGDRTVTLTWNAANSNGDAVDRYEVRIRNTSNGSESTVNVNGTRHTFTGNFDTGYNFIVRAVTNGVAGPWSARSNTATPLDTLPPPSASATIFKGAISPSSCSGCRYVGVDYSNWTPGDYWVTTFLDGASGLSECRYSMGANGALAIHNSLGVRRDSTIRVRFVSVATGTVTWSTPISGEQWNNLGARNRSSDSTSGCR